MTMLTTVYCLVICAISSTVALPEAGKVCLSVNNAESINEHCEPDLLEPPRKLFADGVFDSSDMMTFASLLCSSEDKLTAYSKCLKVNMLYCPDEMALMLQLTRSKVSVLCDGTEVSDFVTKLSHGLSFDFCAGSLLGNTCSTSIRALTSFIRNSNETLEDFMKMQQGRLGDALACVIENASTFDADTNCTTTGRDAVIYATFALSLVVFGATLSQSQMDTVEAVLTRETRDPHLSQIFPWFA